MKSYLSNYYLKKNRSSQPEREKYRQRSTVKFLLTFCTLTALIAPSWQAKAVAEESGFKVTFNPPATGKPQTTTGGASRSIGQCIVEAENSELPLMPLLPAEARSLTVASHPTVLAYLPKTSANKVFFSWQDENNHHYQTILPIENQAGIVSLTLPENAPPLEVGKNYQWAIALMCNGRLQPDSPMIQGQIERVAMTSDLSDRLKDANTLKTAAIYGEAGIWYETVATLAELKTTQPNNSDLKSNWQELLTSVGLEEVAQTPLVN